MNRAEKRRQKKLAEKAAGGSSSQQALNLAVQHHNAGDMVNAEAAYQQALQTDPEQPVALHMLGVIALQQGNADAAVDLISKAIAITPNDTGAHCNLGIAYNALGRLNDAVNSFQKAIAITPNDADAHNNLGNLFKQQGALDDAATSYGNAIAINPEYAEAHNNLGIVFNLLGKLNDAIASYRQAIAINSGYAEAHNNLGNARIELGQLDDAIASFHTAIAVRADFAEAYSNLGHAFKERGQLQEAEASSRQALAIRPDYAEANSNLGNALQMMDRLDDAVECYNKAIAINPKSADAHYNLGNTFQLLGRQDEAVASFQRALAIRPKHAGSHINLGFAQLALGNYQDGLDEQEWRWRNDDIPSNERIFSPPRWDGSQDLNGRTILLWGEQGPGDICIWSSCLSHFSTRTGKCIVECPAKLVALLARSFPNIVVRAENTAANAEPDDFDFHLPMGSLFRHSIPALTETSAPEAYLIPDPGQRNFWKKRLAELGPGQFVGISWNSPVMNTKRSQNYTAIADWAPVFAIPDVTFINLQCNNYDDDLAQAKRDFGVTVHDVEGLDLYDDLDGVASLIGALDLTISVSTAVAAIAGGVGTPTWLVAWRQSYWNNVLLSARGPSVRSFQRDTWEPWDAVFASIAKRLAARNF